MVGAGLLCATALAASAAGTAITQARDAASGGMVGAEVCGPCHEDVARGFAANPHAKTAQTHGGSGVTCEDCHGAGKAHVEGGGDKARIFNPANATTQEVDHLCLGCHQGKDQNFDRSAHAEGNVSCIGCHDIHNSKEKHLLKASQPTLCFECHADVKPQFSMPFHHQVNEGLVQCSDCHDTHGAYEKQGPKSAALQDAMCIKCHEAKAGPWVYDHAVVKIEGCTACHTPHGGPNPQLLNRANVNNICLQCHSPSINFNTDTPGGSYHNPAEPHQLCLSCHTSIHGSNTSAVFFNSSA